MRALLVFCLAASSLRLFFSRASMSMANRRWKSNSPSVNRHWWSLMRSCGEMTPMMRCLHLFLCQSAFQIWLHPHVLSAIWAGGELCSDYGSSCCISGRDEQHAGVYVLHAAVYVFHTVVHLIHSASCALHRQARGVEPAWPSGVPEVSSSQKQWWWGCCRWDFTHAWGCLIPSYVCRLFIVFCYFETIFKTFWIYITLFPGSFWDR